MTAENRRHTVNMATAEAIPPSWLSETCHRKTKETDALDAAAGAEPVLTGVTIGIRMTAGPILTNPGAPDISSEFLEAATHAASARRPAATQRTVGRANHPRFQCRSTGNSRWYTGSACRRARRTRLSAPLPCRPTSPPSGWTRHRSCVWPARRPASPRAQRTALACANPVPQAVRRTPRHRRHRARDREPTYRATFPRDLFQCMTGPGRFASLSARRNDKCAHLRTQMGWFASLCARTRRFGAHLRTQNGPARGNVRAHHSAVRRDSADQASKKPD